MGSKQRRKIKSKAFVSSSEDSSDSDTEKLKIADVWVHNTLQRSNALRASSSRQNFSAHLNVSIPTQTARRCQCLKFVKSYTVKPKLKLVRRIGIDNSIIVNQKLYRLVFCFATVFLCGLYILVPSIAIGGKMWKHSWVKRLVETFYLIEVSQLSIFTSISVRLKRLDNTQQSFEPNTL